MTPDEIHAEFARIQRRNLIAGFVPLLFPGILFLAYGRALVENIDLLLTAFLPLLGAVAWVHLFNWRCPACKAWLGRFFTVQECPSCKVQLRR